MSANPNLPAIDNPFPSNGGLIWHRLRSEREGVCTALLKHVPLICNAVGELQSMEPSKESNREFELKLEARLIQLDDALDRLCDGSYGDCIK